MKKLVILFVPLVIFMFSLNSNLAFSQNNLNLLPKPKEILVKEGRFKIDSNFRISINNYQSERLNATATRMLRRLDGRTGLFFKQFAIRENEHSTNVPFFINFDKKEEEIHNADESYSIKITPEKIYLSASSDLGAMHGLETLLQLLHSDDKGYYFPIVEIKDKPRFAWRGLLLDVCRHFIPMEVLKRNIDGMAAVKMNVLHLHLSEDQGFRIESKKFPKLHLLGSDGLFYSQDQIKEIIQYAKDRGIRVIPEFDMPGHTTSWFVGYPEIASAPGPYSIDRKFGIFNPSMDPSNEKTYQFLDTLLKEMTSLFPDPYFHIGGDENTGKQWDLNEGIQNFKKSKNFKTNHELQSYFNDRILKMLTKYNKNMIGWDEILQPDMPKNIVIQSWRGKESLYEAARKGYKAILSNGFYIDLVQPTDFHYSNDPLPPGVPLTDEEKKNILGGEATMWSEFVTTENIDSRIWPRTAAIAERLWSESSVNDPSEMYKRLKVVSIQLEELGLQHERNYEMMLRRLARGRDIAALKTLVDILEPVKIYERFNQGVNYTSYSPLTQVADAARPDAETARNFRNLVNQYTSSPTDSGLALISEYLTLWKKNHSKLIPLISFSPILKEVEPLSKDLEDLSVIGLEALSLRKKNKKVSSSWVENSLKRIEQAKKPKGKSELMIVSAIESLVKSLKPS